MDAHTVQCMYIKSFGYGYRLALHVLTGLPRQACKCSITSRYHQHKLLVFKYFHAWRSKPASACNATILHGSYNMQDILQPCIKLFFIKTGTVHECKY